MDACLTLADFERYNRGELTPNEAQRFEQHLSTCARCKQSYDSFRADNRFVERVRDELNAPLPAETRPVTLTPRHARADTLTSATLLSGSDAQEPASVRDRLPQIAGYAIKRIVGRGGMGVVYEAMQEKLNRPVALKLLPAVVSTAHPEFITRFKREAAAAARLHHTNIIPIYDFGEARDGYYYAMELIKGQPLSVVIKRLAAEDIHLAASGSLVSLLTDTASTQATDTGHSTTPDVEPPSGGSSTGSRGRAYYRQAARWIAQTAEALHYAHLQGMIHRDIKPSNLMLCTDGRLMILDFGLVKTVDERSVTATGSLVGTYRYMSPEQVGAKRITVDARSDVYSLGATLYELLTYQPVFVAAEQSELLSQILFREPTAPRKIVPSVPIDLQTICLKALEKSPGARYQTAQALAEDLNRYLNDNAIVARRQGLLRRAAKFVRRRRMEVTATSALLLLALVVVLGVRTHSTQSKLDAFLLQREQERRSLDQSGGGRPNEGPTLRDVLVKSGIASWLGRDWDKAEAQFREAFGNVPDYAALVNLANLYIDRYYTTGEDQLDKADQLLDAAIPLDPNRCDAWNAKGVLYQAWHRPTDAIAAYEKARALKENYYPVWVNLGVFHATQGDLTDGERCLLKGAHLAGAQTDGVSGEVLPYLAMAWRDLAAIQLQLGRSDTPETLAIARGLSDSNDPAGPATLVLNAEYYLRQDGELAAQQALDFALSADSQLHRLSGAQPSAADRLQTTSRAKRALALAWLRNRQWKDAAAAAEQALAARDQPAIAHFILAIAAAQIGDLTAARRHLAAAESKWPPELKQAEFRASEDGWSIWFDTAAELQTLQTEARRLIENATTQP